LRPSRRWFLGAAMAGAASAVAVPLARSAPADAAASPGLLERALAALDAHRDRIRFRDVVAVADFSLPSRASRLHLVNVADGRVSSHWVAHGRGSDPAHTGWLERFSNEPCSHATSAGVYVTGDTYFGAHGRSLRLEGLEATNSNAASRAIVVHGAWYVSPAMIGRFGMLGRSEGCFAVAETSLDEVVSRLAAGRLIYAGRSFQA